MLRYQQDDQNETLTMLHNIWTRIATNSAEQESSQHQINDSLLQARLDCCNNTKILLHNQQQSMAWIVEKQEQMAKTLSLALRHLEMQSEQMENMAIKMNAMMEMLLPEQDTYRTTPTNNRKMNVTESSLAPNTMSSSSISISTPLLTAAQADDDNLDIITTETSTTETFETTNYKKLNETESSTIPRNSPTTISSSPSSSSSSLSSIGTLSTTQDDDNNQATTRNISTTSHSGEAHTSQTITAHVQTQYHHTSTTEESTAPASDCQDLARSGNPSGKYTITPTPGLSLEVYCDMDTDVGGWTVFQRRFDGSINFYRGWTDYVRGFGNAEGEYWAGLHQIHEITKSGSWVLRIDLESFGNETAYAEYTSFRIGDAASNYTLSFGQYISGTAGDSLRGHNNMAFSTFDQDHDAYSRNCARNRQGAWWYNRCATSNLNGLYLQASSDRGTGMWWHHWKGVQSLKESEMKIRHE